MTDMSSGRSAVKLKKVLVICPYPYNSAPSQRLKYEQYISYLESEGFSLEIHPFFSLSTYEILYNRGYYVSKFVGVIVGFVKRLFLLTRIPFVDGLYIHLYVVPVGPPLLERLYIMLARSVIYDIDDMVHLLRTSRVNRVAGFFKSNDRIFLLMAGAKHVITCTPVLDKLAQQYNSNTTDISSTIDTDRYQPCNMYENLGKLTLGWSGSVTTAPFLHLLDRILVQLSLRHNVKLLVMGPSAFHIPGIELEVVPWSAEVELETLRRIDIGLYPLPNDDWVHGKSGLKALQYMALGIPVVASDVGCTSRVVQHEHSGYLVKTEEEWLIALELLIANPQLRRILGEHGRRWVEQHYSVYANRPRYLEIFQNTFV